MEAKILEQKDNPLMKRKEISLEVAKETSFTKAEAEQLISEKFSAPVEKIAIKRIMGNFGTKSYKITANIYNSKENKDKIEPKVKPKKTA